MSSNWSGYPISALFANIYDGFRCIFGITPTYDTAYSTPSGAVCSNVLWLIIAYVLSTVCMLQCIEQVLQSSDQLLGRTMSAAVCAAFFLLAIYDSMVHYYSYGIFDSGVNVMDTISILILACGMEVYCRDPEPDVEVTTNYSPTIAK